MCSSFSKNRLESSPMGQELVPTVGVGGKSIEARLWSYSRLPGFGKLLLQTQTKAGRLSAPGLGLQLPWRDLCPPEEPRPAAVNCLFVFFTSSCAAPGLQPCRRGCVAVADFGWMVFCGSSQLFSLHIWPHPHASAESRRLRLIG